MTRPAATQARSVKREATVTQAADKDDTDSGTEWDVYTDPSMWCIDKPRPGPSLSLDRVRPETPEPPKLDVVGLALGRLRLATEVRGPWCPSPQLSLTPPLLTSDVPLISVLCSRLDRRLLPTFSSGTRTDHRDEGRRGHLTIGTGPSISTRYVALPCTVPPSPARG